MFFPLMYLYYYSPSHPNHLLNLKLINQQLNYPVRFSLFLPQQQESGPLYFKMSRRRSDMRVCEVGDCDHTSLCFKFPTDATLSNAWRRFVRTNQVCISSIQLAYICCYDIYCMFHFTQPQRQAQVETHL